MKNNFIQLTSLCTTLLLSACAQDKMMMRPPTHAPGDGATVKLAEAADAVSDSLLELAKIQAVATPPINDRSLPDPNTFGMQGHASIDWSGPIAPLLEKIAATSHFKFKTLGKAPTIPILVSISTKDASLVDILRDIDLQAGQRASIIVEPRSKVIELRYAQA